jgi:hypothetical protein
MKCILESLPDLTHLISTYTYDVYIIKYLPLAYMWIGYVKITMYGTIYT